MQKKSNPMKLRTLEDLKEKFYGQRGTPKREKLERGFEWFKLGVLIHQARLEKGWTKEQLAKRCGINKAIISKVEDDANTAKISTLQKIIEDGLGGRMELSIKL